MHYDQFKIRDTPVLAAFIRYFPFAAISVSIPGEPPMPVLAPLTWRDGSFAGSVEFHIAKDNPAAPFFTEGTSVAMTIMGPATHISPDWYGTETDRSRTAPTYNYVAAVLFGRLAVMDERQLSEQIGNLVRAHEAGVTRPWSMGEIAPEYFLGLRARIRGFHMAIDRFDFTAKLSQEQAIEAKPGILKGLRARGAPQDIAMAEVMAAFDGSPASLARGLAAASPVRDFKG